ncbi:hypothetical protein CL176_02215 [Suicoccus acidiformans]|uniref:Uncharacterized protein n=1 Tax=Suicoccus acidiformans TaxID=2036206 RepID=A0A347WIM6_9LACT|nr:hypothetical protein [Suicoccus acidiformans]AXY24933.1 hypothetical protein CL176_02215 [Suicoccus acidiformans]
MNEINNRTEEIFSSKFDYSIVDDSTASYLSEKEYILTGIHHRYSNEVGKVLYEAQQELSDNHQGVFEKWYTALGFYKTNVYKYINSYKYTLELESRSESEQLEIFNQQPKSIRDEMSKPSAIPEVNQAVFDGDITTHKEYKELEKRLKERDEELAKKDLIIEKQQQMTEILRKKNEQKEIEYVEIKVEPDDYFDNKASLENLGKRNDFLEKQISEMQSQMDEVNQNSEKYKQLSQALQQAQGRLDETQKMIGNYKNLMDLIRGGDEYLSRVSSLVYSDLSEIVKSDGVAKRELDNLIYNTQRFVDDLRALTNGDGIIEGVVIDE